MTFKKKQDLWLRIAQNTEKAYELFWKDIDDVGVKNSYFDFLHLRFDTERAHWLAEWHESALYPAHQFIESYLGLIHIDQEKVDALPAQALDAPIYIATMFLDNEEKPTGLLIDGWHRAKKAYDNNIKELPAVIFTPIETMWILHDLNIYAQA